MVVVDWSPRIAMDLSIVWENTLMSSVACLHLSGFVKVLVCGLGYEIDVVSRAALVQPVNRHSVRTPKMPHRGVTTSLADPNHGLIVFVERKNNLAHANHRPQV